MTVSGNIVYVSGQIVQVTNASGQCLCANISGQSVVANISGQVVATTNTQLIPISKAFIHNGALPAANANWLGADISPTNTPTLFRTMVAISKAGKFFAAVTNGANTQVIQFNNNSNIEASNAYMFDTLVHSGDSINFQCSVTAGTIMVLRVQEIDAATQ